MIRDWSNFIGGRTALVTGSGAGIGRSIAIQMARAGAEGFVVVFVTVDAATGDVVLGPELVTRGWVWESEAEPILEEARVAIRASIADAVAAAEDETIDIETMRRHVRRALGRVISHRTRRRPAIIPMVMEV